MTKQHFIGLADAIREHNRLAELNGSPKFESGHLDTLADFCKGHNSNFMRGRWMDYVHGLCGPNGGNSRTRR